MDREKEQWKDRIMNSLESMQRAEPDPALFEKLRAHLHAKPRRVSLQRVAGMAATFALLCLLNGWTVYSYERSYVLQAAPPQSNPTAQVTQAVAAARPEYDLSTFNFNFY